MISSINKMYSFEVLIFNTLETIKQLQIEFPNQEYDKLPLFIGLKEEFIQLTKENFVNNLIYKRATFVVKKIGLQNTTREDLEILRINFNSPGSFDFLGFGEFFKSIKELLIYYIPNQHDKLQNELIKQEIVLKKEQILAKRIENLKLLNLNKEELTTVIGLQTAEAESLRRLALEGKIQEIEIIEGIEDK